MRGPGPGAVLVLAWLAAFSLRSGFIGLGPALPALTADLGLTFAQASILVSAPTLLMGLASVPGGALVDRWGPSRVIALGLALVAFGGGLRAVAPTYMTILAITVVFGAGIGIAQPPLPRLVRAWFPLRLGVTTGAYASGLICGSIVGAALTVPLMARAGGGVDAWRSPIALWGILAGLTLLIWLAGMRPWRAPEPLAIAATLPRKVVEAAVAWSPWRDSRAWIAAAIFAAQGLVYYLLVAWLPAIYGEAGAGAASTAALFTVFNAATLPGILLFPIWSDHIGKRRPPTIVAAALFTIATIGLMLVPFADPWRWLWPALAGLAVAALFGMSLVLPADIAPRGRTGAAAGMVLGVGYAGAALGPVVAGVVRDLTGSFDATLILLPAIGIAMIGIAACIPELPSSRERE